MIGSSLVLRSIGYRGSALEGLPFDEAGGVIPSDSGRVIDDGGQPVSGVYVTGWIKRGPRGVIGSNRACAEETLEQLWSDFDDGRHKHQAAERDAVFRILQDSGAEPIDWRAWRAIDKAERKSGRSESRPRIKFVDIAEMLATARK